MKSQVWPRADRVPVFSAKPPGDNNSEIRRRLRVAPCTGAGQSALRVQAEEIPPPDSAEDVASLRSSASGTSYRRLPSHISSGGSLSLGSCFPQRLRLLVVQRRSPSRSMVAACLCVGNAFLAVRETCLSEERG